MTEQDTQANPLLINELVYQIPYNGRIENDVPYAESPHCVMDIYYPEETDGPVPAVILVTGVPDPGYKVYMGMLQKDVGWYRSWAKLLAASGVAAICYSNEDPSADLRQLLHTVRDENNGLNLDGDRLGVLAMSGNGANALALLQSDPQLSCAAICYGYTLDCGDSTAVADNLGAFGFRLADSNPEKFPDKIPLMLLRAGREKNPGLNEAMDGFVEEALKRNAALTLVNYPEGEHCFDIIDRSEKSVQIIKQVLGFLLFHLAHADSTSG